MAPEFPPRPTLGDRGYPIHNRSLQRAIHNRSPQLLPIRLQSQARAIGYL